MKDALAKTAEAVGLAAMDPDQALDLAGIAEELGDDIAALGMALFTRVKIPAGGGRAFEIEDADDADKPEVTPTVEGVVVAHHSVNAYWAKKVEDGGNAAPDCASKDGIAGHGKRGLVSDGDYEGPHDCAKCPLNEYGSAASGGKACKNMKHLYVLRKDDILPLLVVLPPMSIKPWRKYFTKTILLKGRKGYGAVTRIGLEKAKNAAGTEYSRATFAFVANLSPAEAEFCRAMGQSLLPMVTEHVPAMLAATAHEEEPF